MNKEKRRVVVTGCGAITPIGLDAQNTWEQCLKGVSGIAPITHFDPSAFACQIAAQVKGFDVTQYLEVKEVKKVDLFSQFAIAAADEALIDAKLIKGRAEKIDGIDPNKTGSIFGVGIGGLSTLERYHQAYLEGGPRRISPFLIPGMISNLAPGNLAIRYGLKGVNFTIQSACTSATHAIGESFRLIQNGLLDVVVSGGAESTITHTGIGGFCALKALSTRNNEPERASRPFDKDRDGFVMGEGAVVLILEERERAVLRGATIYGEVVGYGASCDAYHITAPSIDGEGARSAITQAIESAGILPTDIGYVNAHGTSTDANDSAETAAIKEVFGSWAKEGLVVSSTKSMTGHLLGAAGAIEAMFSLLSLRDGIVPPTINLDTPSPDCDLDYVPHRARKIELQYSISNSFGFGGTNGCLVFKR
jgi:3-oxoacyl-[acyl-carrier-protein] synthase II